MTIEPPIGIFQCIAYHKTDVMIWQCAPYYVYLPRAGAHTHFPATIINRSNT